MSENAVVGPIHPGIILREEFVKPRGLTEDQLAEAIGVPRVRIGEITHADRRITADTGLRLSRFFGTSETFWTGLQERYDREVAKERLGAVLDSIVPFAATS